MENNPVSRLDNKAYIDTMLDKIIHVANGNYDDPVPTRGTNDELDALAMGINMMADEIAYAMKRKDLAEKELIQRSNNLERINKQLDQFAYIVSHDLKAPLRAITNLSMWIEEDLGSNASDEVKGNMQLLRTRVARMETLINGILEYSKAGRMTEQTENVDVNNLVKEVLDMLAPPSSFSIAVPDNLPVLVTERVKLQQVFSNLISNAVKYHHTKQGIITIGYSHAAEQHEFFVQDDGPGIEPAYHEKIFQIFQTLESKDKVESTGIGLTIVQKIIQDKGCAIRLESDKGKGSKFIFTWN